MHRASTELQEWPLLLPLAASSHCSGHRSHELAHEAFRIRETAASTARAPGRGQRSQVVTSTSGDLAAWARRALRLDLDATQSRQSIGELRRRQRSHGSRGSRRPMGGRHVGALRASRRPGRGERTASTRSSSPGRRVGRIARIEGYERRKRKQRHCPRRFAKVSSLHQSVMTAVRAGTNGQKVRYE